MKYQMRPGKGAGSFVSGLLASIFGGIFAFAFTIALIVAAGQSDGGLHVRVILLLLALAGLIPLVAGVRACKLYSFSRQVRAAMMGKEREKLSMLANVTGRDLTRLVTGLRRLSEKGYFPGAYVDLNRREFVVVPGGIQPPISPDGKVLREKRVRSAGPIYIMGAVWLVYAMLFPLYRMQDFIIVSLLSVGALVAAIRLTPKRTVITEEVKKPEPQKPTEKINTGNEELDEVLTAGVAYMNELTALDLSITEPKIDESVRELVSICKQIFDYVKKKPAKVRQIRQFMNYYLPTSINLLKNYDELSHEQFKGENIRGAMARIEEAVGVIMAAFRKELDNLYEDKAMDISVDIEVLQNMMEQEGLTDAQARPGASGKT